MGYRSDVGIIVAFDNLDNMKEVLAVYLLDPRVKKYELMQHWNIYEYDTSKDASYMSDAIYYLQLNECDWKWYDSYDDVQGLKYLCELADKFVEERDEDFNVGWKEVTIGEDGAISEEEGSISPDRGNLQDFCDYILSYTSPEIYWEDKGNEINITLEKESA